MKLIENDIYIPTEEEKRDMALLENLIYFEARDTVYYAEELIEAQIASIEGLIHSSESKMNMLRKNIPKYKSFLARHKESLIHLKGLSQTIHSVEHNTVIWDGVIDIDLDLDEDEGIHIV